MSLCVELKVVEETKPISAEEAKPVEAVAPTPPPAAAPPAKPWYVELFEKLVEWLREVFKL